MELDFFFNMYFLHDELNAVVLIKLRDYIITNDIKDENLEDERVLTDMLRASDRRFVDINPITSELLAKFKKMIICFTIHGLRETPLYHENRAILKVACVEYVLYPMERDNEEYEKIYRCDERKVIEAYNELRGFPKGHIPNDEIVARAKVFFRGEKFFEDNFLETIRSYLEDISPMTDGDILFMQHKSIEIIEGERPKFRLRKAVPDD